MECMIRLVFFDWNGTILSDTAAGLEAENQVLRLFKLTPITIKDHREFFDVPITKFYSKVGINEKTFLEHHAEIQETFHNFYEKRVERCRARAGTVILLKWLRSEGIRSVILSNHTVKGIELHLKRLGLEGYFDAVLANEDIMSTGMKDKAERADEYLRKNNFDPSEILVIGDSAEEAKIATRLCGRSVLVSGGWYSERRLKEAGPDYVIGRLDKLIGVIKNINIDGSR